MKDILYPLRQLHGFIYETKLWHKKRKLYEKQFRKNSKTVFLVLTPEHGNLGDHAIALAEINILKNSDINYIEITGRQLNEMRRKKELSLMNGFPILINGGGNLGTLWMNVEMIEREIIEQNPKSTIIILPNTIYYEDSDWSKEEFEKSKIIYNKHKKLYLYAREKTSFSIMNNAYKNVKLIPDMVFSLNQEKNNKTERHGCLLCLRSDCEKTRNGKQDEIIYQQATGLFSEAISKTDMVVPYNVLPEQRERELEKKFKQFHSAELIITDRLHGMIFATITGTPCIVIDSKSPKVRGCYEWIKDVDYIRFVDDVSRITEEYQKIPKGKHKYNNDHLKRYYHELADDILYKITKR